MNFKKISRGMIVGGFIISGVGILFASSVDVTLLPLGDGKVSTTPKVGYIYACPTSADGGGAEANGSWIHGVTWNLKEKLQVEGSVTWPTAQFTISTGTDSGRTISGNGLPIGSVTGTFPIASTDPVYAIDHNPNAISTQTIFYTLPTNPTVAQTPSCTPMGAIGIALNGVAIFDALDAKNRDAVAHEAQDVCSGHPERQGMYHYHGPSSCLPHQSENAALVGYALDGFGIYSNHDAQGNEIATKDLDECHGTTSEIVWDGKKVSMYHYVITQDYPYTVGCFKGTPSKVVAPKKISTTVPPDSVQAQTTNGVNLFSNDLYFGDKGDEVTSLQTILEKGGYLSVPKGIQKGFFGKATKEALRKFQKVNGISPTGNFGPKTRSFYNSKNSGMEKTTKPLSQEGKNKNVMKDTMRMVNNQYTMLASSTTPPNREKGAPQTGDMTSNGNNQQMPPLGTGNQLGEPHTPPKEAVAACDPKDEGDSCSFIAPGNATITGTCKEIEEMLACVPQH